MLLRVGNAAAVRKGVLLSAACAVCAFAKAAEVCAACKMQEAHTAPLANRNAAVAVCAGLQKG